MLVLLTLLACTPPLERAQAEIEPALTALRECAGEDLGWMTECNQVARDHRGRFHEAAPLVERSLEEQPPSAELLELQALTLWGLAGSVRPATVASECLERAEDSERRVRCTNLLRAALRPHQISLSIREGWIHVSGEPVVTWPLPADEPHGPTASELYETLLIQVQVAKDLGIYGEGGELVLDLSEDLRLSDLGTVLRTAERAGFGHFRVGTPGQVVWEPFHPPRGERHMGEVTANLTQLYGIREVEQALRLSVAEGQPVEVEVFFLPVLVPPSPGTEPAEPILAWEHAWLRQDHGHLTFPPPPPPPHPMASRSIADLIARKGIRIRSVPLADVRPAPPPDCVPLYGSEPALLSSCQERQSAPHHVRLVGEGCALAPSLDGLGAALDWWPLSGTRAAVYSDLPVSTLLPLLHDLRQAGWTELSFGGSPLPTPEDCEQALRSPEDLSLAEARWYGGHRLGWHAVP